MKFIICEDEESESKLLVSYVNKWAALIKENIDIKVYNSAESLLFNWEEESLSDVLLLDIEMPGMNGMDFAKKLREMKSDIQIIFITGVKDYVFEGYSVSAVSYILKPVKQDELFECFEKTRKNISREEPYILINEDRVMKKVKLKDIIYLESFGHYTYIYTKEDKIKSLTGINQLEKDINDKRFFRVHRSYIVSIPWIESITKKDVILEGDILIPIARGKWKEINKAYLDYYREA